MINATHVGEAVVLVGAAKAHQSDASASADGSSEGVRRSDSAEEHLKRDKAIVMLATLAEHDVEERQVLVP